MEPNSTEVNFEYYCVLQLFSIHYSNLSFTPCSCLNMRRQRSISHRVSLSTAYLLLCVFFYYETNRTISSFRIIPSAWEYFVYAKTSNARGSNIVIWTRRIAMMKILCAMLVTGNWISSTVSSRNSKSTPKIWNRLWVDVRPSWKKRNGRRTCYCIACYPGWYSRRGQSKQRSSTLCELLFKSVNLFIVCFLHRI